MRRILITAFEPFGGDAENASLEVLRLLLAGGPIGAVELFGAVLPVVFDDTPLREGIDAASPDALICLGEAGGRAWVSPEALAANEIDARIPDNAGAQPRRVPIEFGGMPRPATIDAERFSVALRDAGIDARCSEDAGRFVCNFVAYHAYGFGIPALFVHVPALRRRGAAGVGAETDPGRAPVQVEARGMSVDRIADGLRRALARGL